MNGNLMYGMAKDRVAERQQAARRDGEARQARAAARARRAADRAQRAVAAPLIPDYAHEMFAELEDAVPAPRHGAGRGRRAQTTR
jgi:hypothetical protein